MEDGGGEMWLGILGQSGCHLSTPALADSARKMTPPLQGPSHWATGAICGGKHWSSAPPHPYGCCFRGVRPPCPGAESSAPAPQRPSDPISPSSPARASASSVVQRRRLTTDSAASPPLSARCRGGGAKPASGSSAHQPTSAGLPMHA